MKKEIIKLIEAHPEQVSAWIDRNSAGLARLHDCITQAENERLQFAEKLKSGDLADFQGGISEMGALAIFDDAASIINSKKGSNPRPGAESQIRKQIIVSMRQFCIGNEDRTLNDFIEAAQAGSIEGLMMKPPPYTFVLTHDEADASRTYKFRGLRTLWTEARKKRSALTS